MTIERIDGKELESLKFIIDTSLGWDESQQISIFLDELKKQKFYRPGLLYCGFNANKKSLDQMLYPDNIFYARPEINFNPEEDRHENPFFFATSHSSYSKPAIAVYDPERLEEVFQDEVGGTFRIKEQGALVAIIILT